MNFLNTPKMQWAIAIAMGISMIGSAAPRESRTPTIGRRNRPAPRRKTKEIANQINPTTKWARQLFDGNSSTVIGCDDSPFISTVFKKSDTNQRKLQMHFERNVRGFVDGRTPEKLLATLRETLRVVLPQAEGRELELRAMKNTPPTGYRWPGDEFHTQWMPCSRPEKVKRSELFRLRCRGGDSFVDVPKDLLSRFAPGDVIHRDRQISFRLPNRETARTGYISSLTSEAAMDGGSEISGIADGRFFVSNDNPFFVTASVHHWAGDVVHQLGGDAYVNLVGVEIHAESGEIWTEFLAKIPLLAYAQLCGAGHGFAQVALNDPQTLEHIQQLCRVKY